MNNPHNNPTTHPELSGRKRRHVLRSAAIRTFRSDQDTERALAVLQQWLNREVEKGDVVSVSMLARRAVNRYRSYVAELSENLPALEAERKVVRHATRLPEAKKK